MPEAQLSYPKANARRLFIRDGKMRSYSPITAASDKRADLKAFRQKDGTPITR